jgi:hypothetical protein
VSKRFAATHETPAGNNLTMMLLASISGTQRGWLYDIIISSYATPASLAGEFAVIRGTVPGTGAGPLNTWGLDPLNTDTGFIADGGTFTGHTKTSNSALLSVGLHQRQTFRWVARPGRQIVIPAVADNWVGIECVSHGGTPNMSFTMHWED